MMNVGLFLEGGGMRGIYTAGVLDYWLKEQVYFPSVLTVSSGTWAATSYLSRQPGRSRKFMMDCATDPRAASIRNWFTKGSMFGMDFLFEEVPKKLLPFDYDTYFQSDQRLISILTDLESGGAFFATNRETQTPYDLKMMLAASISLPIIGKAVKWQGRQLFDGGVANSLPLSKLREEGYERIVIVLNKERGYRKKYDTSERIAGILHRKHAAFVDALKTRYLRYNMDMEEIERLEDEGQIFVIRPSEPMPISRMSRELPLLNKAYRMGYADAKREFIRMIKWMEY
ncbi:patatin-like phospholipase family protein [Paenibacillus qinlingensis]|uniref:patatin-like phospholipase family protein n=1 Tax=Paenibacillus qinlingensis TaxID=1837343 RepID=UPI0015659C23|nr:patatin family protein [Paenibacillus qinlingensis]NQX57964.1 patatin family protein [Paenibacillus qinlingensis]